MAFEGLKIRYPNTTALILGGDVNFLIVCRFLTSYFVIDNYANSIISIISFMIVPIFTGLTTYLTCWRT